MQHELATFALIVASISSFAVAGSFFLNWRARTEQTKIRYIELITQFSKDIGEVSLEGLNIHSKIEFMGWCTKYLQKCETVSHLIDEEKIPKNMTKFLMGNLHDAYNGMKWLDKKYPRKVSLEITCIHLKNIVESNPIDKKLIPEVCMIEGMYNTIGHHEDWEKTL